MRYLLIVLMLGIFACYSEAEDFDNVDQKLYKLRSINAGLTGQVIYERGLGFSETLQLMNDSTFIKERILANDRVLTSKGIYSLIQSDGQNFFKFEHEVENVLIQNCTKELIEYIVILDNKNIYNGSSVPCDGPGYSYKRIE